MIILLVGAESPHANGQTDLTNLALALRNFAKAPNKFFVIPTQGVDVFYFTYTKNSDYFPDSIKVPVFVKQTEFIPCRVESTSKIVLQRFKYNNIG